MVHKQMQTRDYLRNLVSKINKTSGVSFNSSKLNSKEECEKYILNLIKDLKNNSGNNKAYIKEIDGLKEEIEILNTGNKKLESERAFYISQAEGAKKAREIEQYYKEFYKNMSDKWETSYKFQEGKNKIIRDFNIFLSFIIVLEALSIAMLIWK
nr:MAG TPA: Microtubule integrity protein mal3 domain, microtubule-binding, coiled-coil, cell.33A [Caudoviricetes sp.]